MKLWRRLEQRTSRGKDPKGHKGFTMIELAVALAILGILIAIAVPTYLGVRNRAYDSEAKQTLGEIRSLSWSQRLERDTWPQTIDATGYSPTPGARWNYGVTFTDDISPLVITATGMAGEPTDGRTWTLTLTTTGSAELTGP